MQAKSPIWKVILICFSPTSQVLHGISLVCFHGNMCACVGGGRGARLRTSIEIKKQIAQTNKLLDVVKVTGNKTNEAFTTPPM